MAKTPRRPGGGKPASPMSLDAVLARMRELGELKDPADRGWADLRPTALRAFLQQLHGQQKTPEQAAAMFDAMRKRPHLIPPAPPIGTSADH